MSTHWKRSIFGVWYTPDVGRYIRRQRSPFELFHSLKEDEVPMRVWPTFFVRYWYGRLWPWSLNNRIMRDLMKVEV